MDDNSLAFNIVGGTLANLLSKALERFFPEKESNTGTAETSVVNVQVKALRGIDFEGLAVIELKGLVPIPIDVEVRISWEAQETLFLEGQGFEKPGSWSGVFQLIPGDLSVQRRVFANTLTRSGHQMPTRDVNATVNVEVLVDNITLSTFDRLLKYDDLDPYSQNQSILKSHRDTRESYEKIAKDLNRNLTLSELNSMRRKLGINDHF